VDRGGDKLGERGEGIRWTEKQDAAPCHSPLGETHRLDLQTRDWKRDAVLTELPVLQARRQPRIG
jgi:hypothetical protein